MHHWLSTASIFLALVLASEIRVQAQPYVEVSLEMKVLATSPAFSNSTPRIIRATCVTGPDAWWMENDFIHGAKTYQWFGDRTNVYNKLGSTVSVWPSADGQPLGNVSENITWLAFCSGDYLKQPGRLIALPAENLRHTRGRYAYTDQTTTFGDQLGLPKTVDLYASKSLFQKSEDDFDREYAFGERWSEVKKQALTKVEEGKLTFHYEVTASTNFLGQTYPTEFKFSQSPRSYEQNGDWTWTGSGKVTSIRKTEKPTAPTRVGKVIEY